MCQKTEEEKATWAIIPKIIMSSTVDPIWEKSATCTFQVFKRKPFYVKIEVLIGKDFEGEVFNLADLELVHATGGTLQFELKSGKKHEKTESS